jgi:hypothetical protein
MAGRTPSILIGTPCFGGAVTSHYLVSMIALQRRCLERGIGIDIFAIGGESLITRARNSIVERFLDEERHTHLFFVDADIGFHPDAVFRMLDFDRDVVCGIYPVKGLDWQRIARAVEESPDGAEARALGYTVFHFDPRHIEMVEGFAKVRYAPNGFMLIRRNVMTAMRERHPELRYSGTHVGGSGTPAADNGNRFAFFDCLIEPETRVYLSEDYVFCRRWQAMGGDVWADLHSRLTHVGTHAFNGDYSVRLGLGKT